MRNFVLGIIVTLLALAITALGLALLGFLPTRANAPAPQLERHLAMSALDNSVERHAPHVTNPVPPTDENLIDGLKIYAMNCATCHGGVDHQPSALENSFYPPPPNLIREPDDDPEWHIYYVVHNGIRYTGMPAWDKMLSENDIWKVTGFLSRIEKLPPAVQDFWKQAAGGTAPAPVEEPQHHSQHK